LRQPDFLVRFGGEEFVAILPDTDAAEAMVAAERVRSEVQALQLKSGQRTLTLTISIGVAEYQRSETSLDQALARADTALYQAKRGGRNRCVIHDAQMDGAELAAPGLAH